MPRRLLIIALALLVGCGDDEGPGTTPPAWVTDVEGDLPAALSAVGIDAATAYTPPHVLYANGLDKERAVLVPEGEAIDPTGEAWDFPVGTVFSKTFAVDGADIETRLLFRRSEGWEYGLYEWRADGSDADLFEGNWAEKQVTLPNGVAHTLPARLDCRTCHETHQETFDSPVLGVSDYQFVDDLVQQLSFSTPPEQQPVTGRTTAETTAFGYFIGNCISCHTGGRGTNASFSLFPADVIAETVDKETESETGEGIRIVPGDVEASVMFVTVVEAREPDYPGAFKAMPPIGLTMSDPAAEAILRTWIEEL